MKYVQIGILVCLAAIAALLAGIYVGQRGQPDAEQAMSSPVESVAFVAEPETLNAPSPAIAEAPPAPPEKPSPRRPKPVRRTPAEPAAPPQPDPQPDSRAAPSPEPPPPPIAVARPAEPQPPVVETERPEPPPPEPPREPRRVTLPAGTDVAVRLYFALASDRNYGGDTFTATLDKAIVVDDMVIAEKGAPVEGVVVDAVRAGRVKGLAKLSIELVRLDTADGQRVEIVTNRIHRQTEESTKDDMKKVGIGAGIGAIIGAIAGGGKGAAIGAGAGAGAGGGAAAATRGKPVRIPVESRLQFRLMEPLEIVERL